MSKVQVIRGSETGTQTNTYRVTRDDGQLVDAWYDPSLKLWTVYAVELVDAAGQKDLGAQTGPAEYANSKAEALEIAEHVELDFWRVSAMAHGNR